MPAIRAIVQTRQELLEKAAREGPARGSPVACWDFLAVEPNYTVFPCVQEGWLFLRVLAPSSMGEWRQMWTESAPRPRLPPHPPLSEWQYRADK